MSDEHDELQGLTDEEALRRGSEWLRQYAAEGGKSTRKYRCTKCNSMNEVEVDASDPDARMRAVKLLNEMSKETTADDGAAAVKLGQDLSEMSTEELRALYVRLERDA